jgi:hypothetical protein
MKEIEFKKLLASPKGFCNFYEFLINCDAFSKNDYTKEKYRHLLILFQKLKGNIEGSSFIEKIDLYLYVNDLISNYFEDLLFEVVVLEDFCEKLLKKNSNS